MWSSDQEGTGSIRFGSGLFEHLSVRFGSVRTNMFPGSTRFGLRFSDASWLRPVRFGSFPRPVPAGSEIKRFGLVRFGRFGSVLFLFPSCQIRARGPKDLCCLTVTLVRLPEDPILARSCFVSLLRLICSRPLRSCLSS